jgi:hypothetical protein
MEDAVRYHDFHLTGYSVRNYGSELVLHLELPLGGDDESHVRFADVEAYHFVHTGGAIIVDILEIPLAELLDSDWNQLAERWRLHGAIPHWDDDRAKYQATLEGHSYRAWDIGSAIDFGGFVIAKSIEDVTHDYHQPPNQAMQRTAGRPYA